MKTSRLSTILLGAAVAVAGLGWSGEFAQPFSQAEARVGRPLTPVSYAGVARRTTRRTVAATSVAVAASTPTTVVVQQAGYPPECVAAVDSTGATIYRCP